jgi:hypothetical protein
MYNAKPARLALRCGSSGRRLRLRRPNGLHSGLGNPQNDSVLYLNHFLELGPDGSPGSCSGAPASARTGTPTARPAGRRTSSRPGTPGARHYQAPEDLPRVSGHSNPHRSRPSTTPRHSRACHASRRRSASFHRQGASDCSSSRSTKHIDSARSRRRRRKIAWWSRRGRHTPTPLRSAAGSPGRSSREPEPTRL